MSHSLSTTTFLSWTCLKEQLCRDCRNNRDLLVTGRSSFFNPECVPQHQTPRGNVWGAPLRSRIKYTDCFKSIQRWGEVILFFYGLPCEQLFFFCLVESQRGEITPPNHHRREVRQPAVRELKQAVQTISVNVISRTFIYFVPCHSMSTSHLVSFAANAWNICGLSFS